MKRNSICFPTLWEYREVKEEINLPKRDLKPRVKFDAKGRVLISKWLREELKIKEGTVAQLEIYGNDKILLTILGR